MGRACGACHAAKVKCIKKDETNDSEICERCQRLDIPCEPHQSRQGQGPRRSRKKSKSKDEKDIGSRQEKRQRVISSSPPPPPLSVASNPKSTSIAAAATQLLAAAATATSSMSPMLARTQQTPTTTTTTTTMMMMNGRNIPPATTTLMNSPALRYNNNNNPNINNPSSGTMMNVSSHSQKSISNRKNNANNNNATKDKTSKGGGGGGGGGGTRTINSEVEDEIVCKSISGMDYNHYGLHHLIRQWVSLSFTRRSFHLLARASFVASKCGISMDDLLANQSPFAVQTNSQPMTFVSVNILYPREQQSTLGPRVSIQEVPWDLLQTVHIDPNQTAIMNRWCLIRWNTKGTCRFWASPNFERDFASVDEMEKTWVENRLEQIDLWLPKSEKKKFAQSFHNLMYLYKDPSTPCYVTKVRMHVKMRNNTTQPVEANYIQAVKIPDLDTSVHYTEIQFDNNTGGNMLGQQQQEQEQQQHQVDNSIMIATNLVDKSNANDSNNNNNFNSNNSTSSNDPLLDDDIEFTNLTMTDELEEWLNIMGETPQNLSATPF